MAVKIKSLPEYTSAGNVIQKACAKGTLWQSCCLCRQACWILPLP